MTDHLEDAWQRTEERLDALERDIAVIGRLVFDALRTDVELRMAMREDPQTLSLD
jgi:hypothetical protein